MQKIEDRCAQSNIDVLLQFSIALTV